MKTILKIIEKNTVYDNMFSAGRTVNTSIAQYETEGTPYIPNILSERDVIILNEKSYIVSGIETTYGDNSQNITIYV